MKNSFQNERIIIFGASRGLGAAVTSQLQGADLLLISRSISKSVKPLSIALDLDLSREVDQEKAIHEASRFAPHRIFYFSGGGPYGHFADKNWRDHEWALNVNFLFPAKLMHFFLKTPSPQLKQMIFTGSAIAESQPDKNAASYSTSKHALRALLENIWSEGLQIDLRLFSPGYMDTDLLPKKSRPRELEKILDPTEVAQTFCDWALDPKASLHKILK